MADGGQINLRMSLQGAEQVRGELAKMGPAGKQAMGELDRAMRQPTAGLRAVDNAAAGAKAGLEDLAGQSGPVGGFLTRMGPWGLAAAAGLAAVTFAAAAFIAGAREASAAAAELTDQAERIGVGVEELQQWGYVADEAGVSVEAMRANLEKLNGTLGAFKLGLGDAKLKPVFEELGITKEQLANVKSADELMLILADTLGQVQDRAMQVRLARTLGVEDMLPALRMGSDELRRLADEASNLGFVLDKETVAKLDKADRQMEKAGEQLRILKNQAVVPVAVAMGDLASMVSNWIVEMDRGAEKAPKWIQALRAIGQAGTFMGAVNVFNNVRGAMKRGPAHEWDRAEVAAGIANLAAPPTPGFDLQGHTARGGGSSRNAEAERRKREQERLERERERLADRLASEMLAGRRDVTRARFGGDAPENRAQLTRSLLALDRQERDAKLRVLEAEMQKAGALDEQARLHIEQLRSMNAETDRLKDREIMEDLADAKRRALREAEEMHLDLTVDILALASSQARTSEERRAIELQLLEIAQRRQRADLEAAISAEKDAEKRASLVELMDRLPSLFAAQAADVRRRTAGPLEDFWNAQRTGGQGQEFVQTEALNALNGLNRGLIDATTNADSAGDAMKRMGAAGVSAMARVRDALMEIALQRFLIQPLVQGLFGGGAGGGGLLGGFLSNLTGSIMGGGKASGGDSGGLLPGRLLGKGYARGGLNGSSNLYPVGEYGMELIELPVGARIYDHDRSRQILLDDAARARQSAGAATAATPAVNLTANIINRTSEPVAARVQQTPEGLEVILEPMVRGAVQKMGADGGLAKAHALTPKGITR